MLNYVIRRFFSSAAVLLVASFLIYMLVDFAIDPLEDLRTSTAPNKEAMIAARVALLDLDTPAPLRYLSWLGGVGGCFIGKCDLGMAWQTNQQVVDLLGSSLVVSLRLVAVATILAMLVGITVGIVSALRQYSGFDYGMIFLSFLMYSLPTFWIAVLLKQWVAIGFNDFLRDPTLSPAVVIGVGVVVGVVFAAAVGGEWSRRLVVFGIGLVATSGTLGYISATKWLLTPNLGPLLIGLTGVAVAVVVTLLSAGLRNRRALFSALTTAVVLTLAWFPLNSRNGGFFRADWWDTKATVVAALVAIAVGVGIGFAYGGPDKKQSARGAGITGLVVFLLLFVDRVMQMWQPYMNSSVINGRPIATIGSQTPGLSANYWVMQLDTFTHLLLPTMSLLLISFAGYTRYSRASMLEVMNQDYVRTARAKGLTERTVVMRHAFRNSLIPLATIIPIDLAAILGGAIITERIFGWRGMGTMFLSALDKAEIDPVMAYVIVIGGVTVIANFLADLLYAALDPRIRVNA